MKVDTKKLYQQIDREREKKGFLKIEELLALSSAGNVILDPFSILISKQIANEIGVGNIFYPNIILEAANNGKLKIGDKNIFYPQTIILADRGSVIIGNQNQFGDGGVTIKANRIGAEIVVGNLGRYVNGIQIIGQTYLGTGSQLIGGLLTVQDCHLEDGETFQHEDCDLRAGVLKGFGLAKNLKIERGKVINGQGNFKMEDLQNQSFYHKKGK